MFSDLFGAAIMFGLAFAFMNALMGSMNASLLSFRGTFGTTIGFTTVFITLISYEITLLSSRDVIQFFEFFGVTFALSLIPMPFVLFRGSKQAANKLAQIQTASAFALGNFERLAGESSDRKAITYLSLSKCLNDPTTTDADRAAITYLRDNLNAYAHKSGATNDFEASRADVEVWPIKFADRRRSWLRSKT